jgi:hypothetical protein
LFHIFQKIAQQIHNLLQLRCTTSNINISVQLLEGTVDAIGLTYQWFAICTKCSFLDEALKYNYIQEPSATLSISSVIGLDNYQYYWD